ncbi:MAG: glycogen-binding domain-containing protein [Candidatus Eisenbacteria bacterium]|nr:glycogen-binding domain-containing protein [Candidatus Eisenbacteria bacterium]
MRRNALGKGRTIAALLAGTSVALILTSCAGSFNWIEDRLPPPHEVKGGILFQYHAPSARQVTLAGNFNNWGGTQGGGRYDPSIDPMSDPDGDGTWTTVIPLPPGRYQYKFVIDGGVRWEQDPNNADKATEGGIENSLVVVPPDVSYDYEAVTGTVIGEGRGFSTSAEGASAEQTARGVVFKADFPDADAVSVAGEFNKWDPTANPMEKGPDGLWHVTVDLTPGSYKYKFVVDGDWIADPANSDTVDDGYGGVNSVLTVE